MMCGRRPSGSSVHNGEEGVAAVTVGSPHRVTANL